MHHDILSFCNYLIWLQTEFQIAITQKCMLLGKIECWLLRLNINQL